MKPFCENPLCDNEASQEVLVSVRTAGDNRRKLCAACEQVFQWGFQHGMMAFRQGRLFIAVVTDRGIVDYTHAFPSQAEAEDALVKYLRQHHSYRGSSCLESVYDWVGEQAYLTAEIIEQNAPVEKQSPRNRRRSKGGRVPAAFRVEQYELHVASHTVQAKDKAEAILAVFNGQAPMDEGGLQFVEVAEDFYSPDLQLTTAEIDTLGRNRHPMNEDWGVPSIRSVVKA